MFKWQKSWVYHSLSHMKLLLPVRHPEKYLSLCLNYAIFLKGVLDLHICLAVDYLLKKGTFKRRGGVFLFLLFGNPFHCSDVLSNCLQSGPGYAWAPGIFESIPEGSLESLLCFCTLVHEEPLKTRAKQIQWVAVDTFCAGGCMVPSLNSKYESVTMSLL